VRDAQRHGVEMHLTAYVSALPSFADPPDDSLGCLTHVDRISACRLIDPDHDEPSSGRRPDTLASRGNALKAPYSLVDQSLHE